MWDVWRMRSEHGELSVVRALRARRTKDALSLSLQVRKRKELRGGSICRRASDPDVVKQS